MAVMKVPARIVLPWFQVVRFLLTLAETLMSVVNYMKSSHIRLHHYLLAKTMTSLTRFMCTAGQSTSNGRFIQFQCRCTVRFVETGWHLSDYIH